MTIKGGYILQPRCFDESEASKFPPATREIWFYILRKVNHKDNGKFKRGQGFFQFKDIQNDLQWCVGYRCETYSKPQITKALRRLREGNMIATAKETRGILITVVNYNIYQDPELYEGNDEGSTKDQRRFSNGRTINKNVKNDKNVKKESKTIVEKEPLDSVVMVINYLNQKSGKKFSSKSEANRKIIRARFLDGFVIEDFFKAIDNQCREWSGTSMGKFIRPETLFRASKFDGYVNNVDKGDTNARDAALLEKYQTA
jgi:uncharacterized phage protein (TIGR02220 family)